LIFEVLSGKDVYGPLLDCEAVRTCRCAPTFRRNIQPPFSGLSLVVCFSKTLATIHNSTRRHNLEYHGALAAGVHYKSGFQVLVALNVESYTIFRQTLQLSTLGLKASWI
jgi:hypothetical protein